MRARKRKNGVGPAKLEKPTLAMVEVPSEKSSTRVQMLALCTCKQVT